MHNYLLVPYFLWQWSIPTPPFKFLIFTLRIIILVLIFVHRLTITIAMAFTLQAKLMVQVSFESGKVKFLSQKAIIRPSRQNYR